MPWRSSCATDQIKQFVTLYERGEHTISELAADFGISRKTAHKWLRRYADEGLEGLEARSHEAHRQPHLLPSELEEVLLRGREQYPTWGPKKLVAWAERTLNVSRFCAVSTAGEVLKRHGLSVPRVRTRKSEPCHAPLTPGTRVNELWCIDFKGWLRLGDRSRCDPLTITDAHSRYLLKCQALRSMRLEETQRVMEATFREFGLPERIRSDNGTPFSGLGLGGLSALSLWWLKLGITPERIAPGKPYQNGSHERMHLTLKQATAMPPAHTMAAQQRRFNDFRQEYNEERPHEALAQQVPASRYQPSPRPYPRRVPAPEYDAGAELRKVQQRGEIYWAGGTVFVGEAFRGEHLELRQIADGVREVRFAHLVLGLLHAGARVVKPLDRSRQKS